MQDDEGIGKLLQEIFEMEQPKIIASTLTRLVLASAYHLRNALQPCCHDSLRSEIF